MGGKGEGEEERVQPYMQAEHFTFNLFSQNPPSSVFIKSDEEREEKVIWILVWRGSVQELPVEETLMAHFYLEVKERENKDGRFLSTFLRS